jgi:hypothetical protein
MKIQVVINALDGGHLRYSLEKIMNIPRLPELGINTISESWDITIPGYEKNLYGIPNLDSLGTTMR